MVEGEVFANPNLSVETVGMRELIKLRMVHGNAIRVNQAGQNGNPWEEVDCDTAVLNDRAGVCQIVYVFDWNKNKCFSGHFPTISDEFGDALGEALDRYSQSHESGDKLITASYTDYRDLQPYLSSYYSSEMQDYVDFLERVRRVISGSDKKKSGIISFWAQLHRSRKRYCAECIGVF